MNICKGVYNSFNISDAFQLYATQNYKNHKVAYIMRTFLPEEIKFMIKNAGYNIDFNSFYDDFIVLVDPPQDLLKEIQNQFKNRISLYIYQG